MLFQQLQQEDGWVIVDYSATWAYDYDFMLDAVQAAVNADFQDGLQRVACAETPGGQDTELLGEVQANGFSLRNCPTLTREYGALMAAGQSRLMGCPVQLCLFAGTRVVRVISPDTDFFARQGEHAFDNYMDSLEIKAYCLGTERRVRRELSREPR